MSKALAALEGVRRAVREAQHTDAIVPTWLALLPAILGALVGIIFLAAIGSLLVVMPAATIGPTVDGDLPPGMGAAFAAFLAMFTLAMFLGLVALVVQLYVLYKFIDRRNQHIKRTQMMYEDVAQILDDLGFKERAEAIRRYVREMQFEVGGEKSAILWVVLVFLISIIAFYVYHFLNKDFYRHSKYEQGILEEVNRVFEDAGVRTIDLRSYVPVQERSTILYLILSIITFGIFTIYWIYTLAKDPNEHFMSHAKIEPDLLAGLEELVNKQAKTE